MPGLFMVGDCVPCAFRGGCSACLTSTRWHVEDLGLGAMNSMAWGAPKLWLLAATHQAAEALLELLVHKYGSRREALQRLYYKQLLAQDISLEEALDAGLTPFVQEPGTALYTLPGTQAIHITVSAGFSVAVSANNFFSDSSSLVQHLADLEAAQHADVMFPGQLAADGHNAGHVNAREGLQPLLCKLQEAEAAAAHQ